jgi:hypothetical protein
MNKEHFFFAPEGKTEGKDNSGKTNAGKTYQCKLCGGYGHNSRGHAKATGDASVSTPASKKDKGESGFSAVEK